MTTTVSTNDKQFVQELGADHIIDYKKENFEDVIHDYDAVLDTVGGETYIRSFSLEKRRYNCFNARTTKLRVNEPIWNKSNISICAGKQRATD